MNPNTGHLVADLNDVPESKRNEYQRIPKELEPEAKQALEGKREVYVRLRSNSELAGFAARVRKERKRNKTAKKSRRVNR